MVALLALLLQMASPVWTVDAWAAMPPDLPICGASTGPHAPPADHHHAHEHLCPACHICCAGLHAALPAAGVGVPLPGGPMLVAGSAFAPSLPRGPPPARPKARAPPAFSV